MPRAGNGTRDVDPSIDPLGAKLLTRLMQHERVGTARLPGLERDLRIRSLVEEQGVARRDDLHRQLSRHRREEPLAFARDRDLYPRRERVAADEGLEPLRGQRRPCAFPRRPEQRSVAGRSPKPTFEYSYRAPMSRGSSYSDRNA